MMRERLPHAAAHGLLPASETYWRGLLRRRSAACQYVGLQPIAALSHIGMSWKLGSFTELVVRRHPVEGGDQHVVRSLSQCLFVMGQLASDEGADNSVNDREESEDNDDFEGASGQHDINSC